MSIYSLLLSISFFPGRYYNTGLSILVRSVTASPSGWDWIRPFTGWLWLAILLTMLIFPAFIFAIEFGSLKQRVYASDVVPGVQEATVRSMWTLLGMETLQVSSVGAKIASLCFAFMALILVNTYTANLAAVLTVNQINGQVRSIEDLRGKAVAADSIYIPRLRTRYGVIASEIPFEDESDLVTAGQEVESGVLTALISDEPLLQYLLDNTEGCTIKLLPQQIEPFSYGIAFKPGTSAEVVDTFSGEWRHREQVDAVGWQSGGAAC